MLIAREIMPFTVPVQSFSHSSRGMPGLTDDPHYEIYRNIFRMWIGNGEYQTPFDHVGMFPTLIRTSP